MAKLVHKFFGDLSGKFGDVVFRIINGENVITQAPSDYTPPDTQEYRDRLARFKMAALFGAVSSRLTELKTIWGKLYPAKRMYNILFSLNYPVAQPEEISTSAVISPDSGFGSRLDSIVLTASSLTVNLLPLTAESGIDPAVEKTVKLQAVIMLSDPLDATVPAYHLFKMASGATVFNLTDPITFTVNLSTADVEKMTHYAVKKVFCSFVTLDADNAPIQAARTLCAVA